MFLFDSYYIILVVPALIFALFAQMKVKSTFNKYKNINNSNRFTGSEIASRLLRASGIYDVRIEPVEGVLTDHYDPRNKVLRLSKDVYFGTSVAAAGIAAHETGHALQHNVGYAPLHLRSNIVPIANIGSSIGPILAIIGIIFGSPFFIQFGIILYSVAVIFTLITLPVEFNASNRAVALLTNNNNLMATEIKGVKKVLNAAALTYVASAAVAILSLLRLILLSNSRN